MTTSASGAQRVVLVTGIGSGIGLELARLLWKDPHFRVIATARKHALLKVQNEEFKENERFLLRPMDITSSADRLSVIAEAKSRFGGVDILVNNAGISFSSVVEHMTDTEDRVQLDTNFLGPMALTRMVLPHMRRQRWGRIINVSSVGGMMAMPTMGSYSASKFALEGASEALWYEMRPWSVKVSLVEPGFIHSESFRKVYLSDAARRSIETNADYAVYYERMSAFIEKIMCRAIATPKSVATTIYHTMNRNDPPLRVAGTIDAYFFSMLRRLLPQRLYHDVLYSRLPGITQWGHSNEDQ